MTMPAFRTALVLAWAALVGCDGIGRAIIDETPDGVPRMAECSDQSPSCDTAPALALPLVPPLRVALGLEQCASTNATCMGTPSSPDVSAPRSYADLQGCSLTVALPAGDSPTLGRATCVVLSLLPAQPASQVRLAGLSIEQSSLVLDSDTPVIVELARSRLVGVHLTLRGPVTLRVIDQSSLKDVWVDQQASASGVTGASFGLIESAAQRLTVALLDGDIEITRSSLAFSALWAEDLTLEAVSISQVSCVAEALDAVELDGRGLTLQIGRGTLSHLELVELDVQRCRTLLVSGSRVSRSTFAACAEKLRVDYSAVSGSVLSGPIESSVGTWLENSFGAGGANTDVELWGGGQLSNRYCQGVSRVSYGDVSTIECNSCVDLPMPEVRLCPAVPFNDQKPPTLRQPADNPACPVLADLERRPVCAPPVRNEHPF